MELCRRDSRSENQETNENRFRFRIASVTKTFTATVVLQLAGENRLNLDDSIEKWLPGIIQGNGYDDNQITIRQILNHTSGIAEYSRSKEANFFTNTTKSFTAEELVKIRLSLPPDFAPGKGWSYSNTGYVLLGILIEKVNGNSYAEEMKIGLLNRLNCRIHSYLAIQALFQAPSMPVDIYNQTRQVS